MSSGIRVAGYSIFAIDHGPWTIDYLKGFTT